MKSFYTAALAALLALPAAAHEYTAGALTVDHPMAFETPKTARVGGGYLTITNGGDSADRLVSISAEGFDEVSLHETTTDDMGVARMSHIDGLDLPAGETVTLKPGGLHIMFMGLDGDPFEEGEEIAMLADAKLSLLGLMDFGGFLTHPGLWLGLVVCGLFTAAAIYVRRYRDDS